MSSGTVINDKAIIEGCIAGKRASQKQLYDRFAAEMFSVCLRYVQNRDEAEDLLQEGFIRVFTSIRAYRGEGSLAGWIKRIMINLAINQLKRQKRVPHFEDIGRVADTGSAEEDANNSNPVSGDQLMQWIRELPEGYRMVFNLFVMEDWSHREIAEQLGISENTSKTQLLKARKWLAGRIREFETNKRFAL